MFLRSFGEIKNLIMQNNDQCGSERGHTEILAPGSVTVGSLEKLDTDGTVKESALECNLHEEEKDEKMNTKH